MAWVSKTSRSSFASGEVSPSVRAANDLARFQTGAEKVENMVVVVEAILIRRPGTRFIAEAKTESEAGKMFPFRRSGSDYYVCAFNGGAMRLIYDAGIVESAPAVPFELAVPWVAADMPNLRSGVSDNTMIQVCAGKAPQQLTRLSHTSWSITQFRPQNGPVDVPNLNTGITIQASAVLGSGITLTGAGAPFVAGQVDGIFKLEEPNQSLVPLWQANETITLTTESVPGATGTIGDVTNAANAFDGNSATYAHKAAATEAYCGRVVSPASRILSASVLMLKPISPDGGTVTLRLYGKNGTPASATDGTMLAEKSYDVDLAGGDTHVLTSTDAQTTYTNLWIRAAYSGAALEIRFGEITLTRLASASAAVLRRWNGNVYQALASGNTGANAPIHIDGDVAAGTGNVTWRYLHSGYGYVQMTGFTNSNLATGTVLTRLPDSVVSNASYRFSPPAWCAAAGWPKQISTHDQRAYFARDNIYWLTRPTTLDDFEIVAADDSAIARRLISPDGSLVVLEWALSSGILVQGARDNEWLTRAPGNFDALTVTSVRDIPDTFEGSAPHIPALVDRGAVFIGRSRDRIHYVKFNRLAEQLEIQEVSIAARHLFGGARAVAMAWQRDPHRLLWIALDDGSLACLTFMPDEKVTGWHRHPMENCFVEDLVSIPTNDNGRSEIYLQTRRTINAQTRRYYELLMPFFKPLVAAAPTAEGAWFVDCGLQYQGAPVMTIGGLDHLIGETVAVFADGAEQKRKVVAADGTIVLDAEGSDVVVGLPIQWRFRDLPRDIQIEGGTSKGNPKRASHIFIDVLNSAGGLVSFNESEWEPITETGAADYDEPIPLVSGLQHVSIASATEDEGVLELVGDNALPFTICAITPALEIEDPPDV